MSPAAKGAESEIIAHWAKLSPEIGNDLAVQLGFGPARSGVVNFSDRKLIYLCAHAGAGKKLHCHKTS